MRGAAPATRSHQRSSSPLFLLPEAGFALQSDVSQAVKGACAKLPFLSGMNTLSACARSGLMELRGAPLSSSLDDRSWASQGVCTCYQGD